MSVISQLECLDIDGGAGHDDDDILTNVLVLFSHVA
jgi:hypothetical protein